MAALTAPSLVIPTSACKTAGRNQVAEKSVSSLICRHGGLSRSSLSGSIAGLESRSVSHARPSRVVSTSAVATEAKPKLRGQYEIQALTNWLLMQESSGVIDNELTVVLSSISLACKQIASLVTRAGISNLTGVQGAVNVQGEDQKKLDVISNEVGMPSNSSLHYARMGTVKILCTSGVRQKKH